MYGIIFGVTWMMSRDPIQRPAWLNGNVIEWAKNQGLEPIRVAADQKGTDPKSYEYDKRIGSLEGRMDEQDKKLDQILAAVAK